MNQIMDQVMIGQFLKQVRTEKGLTQKAVADELGISDKTVSKWENGRGLPKPSLMIPLCELLGITVNELLSKTCSLGLFKKGGGKHDELS